MPSCFTYGSLFLSFAFGIIGMSLAINAVIKSNRSKHFVQDNAPEGVLVNIDTSELLRPGAVVLAGCALLALTSLLTLLSLTLLKPITRTRILATSVAHFFWGTWILAALIAYNVIARNREAKVTVFWGETQLPDSLIRQREEALGSSRVFWDHGYIRNLAIVPWLAVLFAMIVGVERLLAARKFNTSRVTKGDGSGEGEGGALRAAETRETAETDKPSEEKRESV